jgi:hypothetical protein
MILVHYMMLCLKKIMCHIKYIIPTKVNIQTIDGIDGSKNPAPFNEEINKLIKPFPIQYQEKLADNILVPNGTALDIETTMQFLAEGATMKLNRLCYKGLKMLI